MIDRKKVVKGLRCCSVMDGKACFKCPYHDECYDGGSYGAYGIPHLASDAFELLKEQEPVLAYEFEISKCVCGEVLNRYVYPNFCGNCGRKLIWHHNRREN
jgi:hypothetical protein